MRFKYKTLLEDVRHMAKLGKPLLTSDAIMVMDKLLKNIDNVRGGNRRSHNRHVISIPRDYPLRTLISRSYDRATRPVVGTFSFTWEINNPDAGQHQQRNFDVVGEATTSIKLYELDVEEDHDDRIWSMGDIDDELNLIAQWQMEIGDATSRNGCHLHSAFNQYGDSGIFPEWLKVPRLPSFLVWPMDALEFMLGELFQNKWKECVSKDNSTRNAWRNSQAHRFSRIFDWYRTTMNDASTSPWMEIKGDRCPRDLMGVE